MIKKYRGLRIIILLFLFLTTIFVISKPTHALRASQEIPTNPLSNALQGSYSVSVSPTLVIPEQTVNVTWSNSSPTGNDWISLHPEGAPDANYLTWQSANGGGGTLIFTAPSQPGRYDFRLFSNGPKVATSNAFEVINQQPSQPNISCSVDSLDISPLKGLVGTEFTISGSGSCNTGVRAIRFKVDDGIIYEIGAPSANTRWNSSGASLGLHIVKIEVAGLGDNDWSYAASQSAWLNVFTDTEELSSPAGVETKAIDIREYCLSQGYNDTVVDRTNAFSWGCKLTANGEIVGIDMNSLCQWGYNGTHPYPSLLNPHDAWTWGCSNQPVNIPTQTTTTPSRANNTNSNNVPSSNSNPPLNSTNCMDARGPSFQVGDRGYVPYGDGSTAIYAEPNSRPQLGVMQEGEKFVIEGGPVCVRGRNGNLISWLVRSDLGLAGWASEGYLSSPFAWIALVEETRSSQQPLLQYDFNGNSVASDSAAIKPSPPNCQIGAHAHYRSESGGFILEIMSNPLPEEFDVYFLGIRVPNADWSVRHNGFASTPTNGSSTSIYLGISTRFAALLGFTPLIDGVWSVWHPC